MEEKIILFGIIVTLAFIIIFLIKNKGINMIIDSKKKLLEENSEEILKNLNIQNLTWSVTSKVTTQKTIKKIIYKNGEKTSEETSNTKNEIHSETFTNGPNCGAKIKNPDTTNCLYCNTTLIKLINMNISTKKDWVCK